MTSTEKLVDGQATVQTVGDYDLVTYGGWQVTVMPDATVSLPRLVRPEDIDDFCGAMKAAKDVALARRAAAQESEEAAVQAKKAEREQANEARQGRRQRRSARAKQEVDTARASRGRASGKTELAQDGEES